MLDGADETAGPIVKVAVVATAEAEAGHFFFCGEEKKDDCDESGDETTKHNDDELR